MDHIELLDKNECSHWLGMVDSLRPQWQARRPPYPFFTLGAASYLDASPRSRQAYEDGRRVSSPLLRNGFGALLDCVAAAVAQANGMPARFDAEHYALPGFHIYEAHPDFAAPVAKIHCDRQYEALDWSPHGVDPVNGRTLSFTLSLQLPSGGSGLYTWPISHRDSTVDRETAKRSFTNEQREYHPYSEGVLIIHSGDLVHQAVIQCDPDATGRRITLQGHAVELPDSWLLYW